MELQVGMKIVRHTYLSFVVKSYPGPHQLSVILLDQNSASVWNFWWKYTPLFDMISFSSFCFETWLSYSFMSLHVLIIYIYFEYFWDLHCVPIFFYTLGPSCVPSFSTFLHSLAVSFKYARDNILEHGVFMLVVMENMFQCISSVGIVVYLWRVCEL